MDGLFQLAGQQVLLEEGMLEKFTLSLKPQSPKSAPASIQQGKKENIMSVFKLVSIEV